MARDSSRKLGPPLQRMLAQADVTIHRPHRQAEPAGFSSVNTQGRDVAERAAAEVNQTTTIPEAPGCPRQHIFLHKEALPEVWLRGTRQRDYPFCQLLSRMPLRARRSNAQHDYTLE